MLWNEVTARPPLTSLFFLTHPRAHKHTHRHKPCVLSAVSLSSHILHGAFPYMQPHTGTLWADPAPDLVCFWVVIPLWGLCLRPALAPTGEKMLVVRTGPGRGLSQRGGAGRYQKAQDLVASDQRSCLFINWVPKAIVFDSHNRSFLFSCLTWGIMQVTQFFPSDFGSFQDIKKDVDICVFLGLMPPVMIEEFVWFLSFCWHYQQLLPLFYDTSGRQQWLCQTVFVFQGKSWWTSGANHEGKWILSPLGWFSGSSESSQASCSRKVLLVHVYRRRYFMVISDLKILNSGSLAVKPMWGQV